MSVSQLPTRIVPANRLLTAAEFHQLADVPPEVEWFANLTNPNTRRSYENAVKDFMRFAGVGRPQEFRAVTRAHVIAWRDDLRTRVTRRCEPWSDASIRHRLSALAALFEYLCDRNAVTHNPVKGVARPKSESGEGKTPALGDHQARKLLDAPLLVGMGEAPTCDHFSRAMPRGAARQFRRLQRPQGGAHRTLVR